MNQSSMDDLLAKVQADTAAVKKAADDPLTNASSVVQATQALDAAVATVNEIAGALEPATPPRATAEDAAPAASGSADIAPASEASPEPATDIRRLLALEVPVIVQLGMRRLTVSEVMRLAVGAIVEFGKSAEEELDLLINNKLVGKGHAVKVGENFGIKISAIDSVKDTIRKLGAI